MDIWLLLLLLLPFLSLTLSFTLKLLLPTPHNSRRKLPPGPPAILILAKIVWERSSIFDIEPVLRQLHARYGPIVTLPITSPPTIFIADRHLAHQALAKGAALADRPPATEPNRLLTSNQHNISSSAYGPLWRLLRRNLTAEILHPSRVKLFAPARRWVLHVLADKLRAEAAAGGGVVVAVESFQYAMFCLLVLMCFGEKPDEMVIRDMEETQRFLSLLFTTFNVFEFVPAITKLVFWKRWSEIVEARRKLEEIFATLVKARQDGRRRTGEHSFAYAYVDSLVELRLPEEGGRKLSSGEMASLFSEFLSAGTETTTTALQWIMANVVKSPDIQAKLVEEIEGVVGGEAEEVEEEDLQRMPYLKAVIMEGLRRHPPGHFVLPHAASEDVELAGYKIPGGAVVNFEIAEMHWDGTAWEEPGEFRPERFMGGGGSGEGVDITGSREIKMMPFGAGRRICPGIGLAMMHLEYLIANAVWMFEWEAEGAVDMSEKLEFTVVMKNPLRARITPRRRF